MTSNSVQPVKSQTGLPAADELLKQFILLAQEITDAATPQDKELLANISSDPRYLRALQGLQLLARHHIGPLVTALTTWRSSTQSSIMEKYSRDGMMHVVGVCKRAAMEILFLDASLRLFLVYSPEFFNNKVFVNFHDNMQQVLFRWLINSDDYVPQPELAPVRYHVVATCARILGVLSGIRLDTITDTFVKRLEERVTPRKDSNARVDHNQCRVQVLRLCAGLREVRLSFNTDEQLQASITFLNRAHPLAYTAAERKSQVHHAMGEMMTDVLTPLVRSGQPGNCRGLNPRLLLEWYATVLKLKNDIGQWINKHAKHIQVGYPLVTVLVCLVDDDNYAKLLDSMADFLMKQMKSKEHRSLCFTCYSQLVQSYLTRYGRLRSKAEVAQWLDRCIKPLLANARKGTVPLAELQDLIVELGRSLPEYAVGVMIVDLLQSDVHDCQLVALKALYAVVVDSPGDGASAAARSSRERAGSVAAAGVGVSGSSNELLRHSSSSNLLSRSFNHRILPQQVLDRLRRGQHPLDALGIGHLLPRILPLLARLLLSFHGSYGGYMSYSLDAAVPREKQPQLVLYGLVLLLAPYFKPEQWPGVRPLDLLPAYTAHSEATIRGAANDGLQAIVRGVPHLRNAVLISMAVFISAVPDECTQAIYAGLLLLRNLTEAWMAIVTERNAAVAAGGAAGGDLAPEPSSLDARQLDLHRLEAAMFALLCSTEEAVRREALGMLRLLRALHKALHTNRHVEQAGTPMSGSSRVSRTVAVSPPPILNAPGISGADAIAASVQQHQHRPSKSGDSADLLPSGPSFLADDDQLVYLIDVFEQSEADIVRRCYWDFSDWSDLWREYNAVPHMDTPPLEATMAARDDIGKLRWSRYLCELVREALPLCPATMAHAHAEVSSKLLRAMSRDYTGRWSLAAETGEAREGRRGSEAWKNYVMVATACPAGVRAPVERLAKKMSPFPTRDLIRSLLTLVTLGHAQAHQQLCIMALGHTHPDHYPCLFEELTPLMEEYGKGVKQKSKGMGAAELRKIVANVLRIVADAMPGHSLDALLLMRSRYIEFIRDTYNYLRNCPPFSESFWEASQLAYCLCAVVRCVARHLVPQLSMPLHMLKEIALLKSASARTSVEATSTSLQSRSEDLGLSSPPTRKLLYEMFASWCEEGRGYSHDYSEKLRAGMAQALNRMRDYEQVDGLKTELSQTAELLDHAARMAMAATLDGPVFDTDTRRPQGPVLSWVDRLLKAPPGGSSGGGARSGPPRATVAQAALFNLLEANLDMFNVCVDRCYDAQSSVSTGYFQVVSEVYDKHEALRCDPHVLLSLVLYKMVDQLELVREVALHMLHVLSHREWGAPRLQQGPAVAGAGDGNAAGAVRSRLGAAPQQPGHQRRSSGGGGGGGGTVVVLGNLQDSYQQFQYQLSAKLARDHPELSEQLCEEMMTRQLECLDGFSQHPVLSCLAPWMENLSIASHWKGTWCERLLKSMYYVTLRHGGGFPMEIERLWSTLAANRRNIIPILDFLATLGTQLAYQELNALLEYFAVGKRIVLYLARTSPLQTIDHLVYEASLQLYEEEDAGEAGGGGGGGGPHALQPSLEFSGTNVRHDVMIAAAGASAGAPLARTSLAALGLSAVLTSHERLSLADSPARGSRNSALDLQRQISNPATRSDSQTSKTSFPGAAAPAMSLTESLTGLPRPVNTSFKGDDSAYAPSATGLEGGLRQSLLSSAPPEPTSPGLAALLTRPELALCLLTEVAYEHDADFAHHLALLFHLALISLDAEEGLVAEHSQQLLVNMLYSLSARHLEVAGAAGHRVECVQASNLIKYLQSVKGRRLWAYEDVSLTCSQLPSVQQLESMVASVVDAMFFEPSFRSDWSSQALDWALHSRSRHLACRSQQVFRALQPELNAEVCNTLLTCLQQCMAAHQQPAAKECALEILITFQTLVGHVQPAKLLLFPQLFWACIALLHTNYVHIFQAAMALLQRVLQHLQLHDVTTQNLLLAAAPLGELSPDVLLMRSAPHAADATTSSSRASPDAAAAATAAAGQGGGASVLTWPLGAVLNAPSAVVPSVLPLAVQQLLWKGLLFQETELLTMQVLQQLAEQLTQLCNCLEHPPGHHHPSASPRHHASRPGGSAHPQADRSTPASISPREPLRSDSPSVAESHYGVDPINPEFSRSSRPASSLGEYQGDRDEDGPSTSYRAAPPPGSSIAASLSATVRRRAALQQSVFEALLGERECQALASILALLPFAACQARAPSEDPGVAGALATCIQAVADSCYSLGHAGLADRLLPLATATASRLPLLLSRLAPHLCAAFFPRHAYWLLSRCVALLQLPQAAHLHEHVLALLKCIFEVPRLQLGPAAGLVTGSGLFNAITSIAQGPMGQHALQALGAVMAFARWSPEVASFQAASTSFPAELQGGLEPGPLISSVLPVDTDVGLMLSRILDSATGAGRKRKGKLMPFIADSSGGNNDPAQDNGNP